MKDIMYLLKFGEREHIESFSKGNLYFGNAKLYREIEDNLKIKGQGDGLEASTKVYSNNMRVHDYETHELAAVFQDMDVRVVFRYPDADPIPVFCLFAVTNDNCKIDENGEYKIALSEKTKAAIRNHFPKADSVAIIKAPDQFLTDVENTIGVDVRHELVNYFNIDEGYRIDKSGKQITAMDHEYSMYLMQDTPPTINEEGRKVYSFSSEYVFRVLFCKDVFFREESEYRIILPKEKIEEGKIYHVDLSEDIEIKSLDDFFSES